jgi:hypothetical protein
MSVLPIIWISVQVHDGKNEYTFVYNTIQDTVWETMYKTTTNFRLRMEMIVHAE